MRSYPIPLAYGVLALFLLYQGVCNPGFPGNSDFPPITYQTFPNQRVPAISHPGGCFTVGQKASRVFIDGIRADVIGSRVIVPSNISYGFHNLILCGEGCIDLPRSLYIYPYNQSFCIAHISDSHVGSPEFNLSNFTKIAEEINSIGPAFIIHTGDVVDHGHKWEYEWYKQIESIFEPPVFYSPGNHEVYSDPFLAGFSSIIAPANYSFEFHGYKFISVPSPVPRRTTGYISRQILNWLDGEMNGSGRNVIYMHHEPFLHPATATVFLTFVKEPMSSLENVNEFLSVVWRHNVTAVLGGHEHLSHESEVNGTRFIVTTSTENGFSFHWWDFRNKSELGKLENYTGYRLICFNDSGITFDQSLPIGSINVTREVTADGIAIKITNNFSSTYPFAVLRVKLQKCDEHEVYGAQLLQISNCEAWIGASVPPEEYVIVIR